MNKKFQKLLQFVGNAEMCDLAEIGVTMKEMPMALLENAQNQTGISLTPEEEKQILKLIKQQI